jgi:hypothetical protein
MLRFPTTEMFRMPFVELLASMRQVLGFFHLRVPDVESTLRCCARADRAA